MKKIVLIFLAFITHFNIVHGGYITTSRCVEGIVPLIITMGGGQLSPWIGSAGCAVLGLVGYRAYADGEIAKLEEEKKSTSNTYAHARCDCNIKSYNTYQKISQGLQIALPCVLTLVFYSLSQKTNLDFKSRACHSAVSGCFGRLAFLDLVIQILL